MQPEDFECMHCKDVGLKRLIDREAVWLICPRCKTRAAVMWLEEPVPDIPGQMSLKDYPETGT